MTPTIAIPHAVFVLAMNAEEEFGGWTVSEVQTRFFLGATDSYGDSMLSPQFPGRYRYIKQAPDETKVAPGTLFLFQFKESHRECKAAIIASAVLVRITQYAEPDEGKYNGAFWFMPDSVRIFHPVSADEMKVVWPEPEFVGFSRSQYLSPPSNYLHLHSRLRGIAAPVINRPVTGA